MAGVPTVSVIIPSYNRKKLLEEAVLSVLNQHYRDFELLVIDDGSEDGTEGLMRGYENRLHYVRTSHQGVSAARNHGIGLARGEFITFLDSDDLWRPAKLQAQVDFMDAHREAQICYTDEIWIRRGVRVNPRKRHRKHSGWILARMLPLCIISPSSVLMRRGFFERVGTFDERMPVCEDYDLWLRAALRMPVHFIPRQLIVKRGGHADQLSRGWGYDRWRVYALEKLLADRELQPEQQPLVLQELVAKLEVLEPGYRKHGRTAEADVFADKLRRYQEELAAECPDRSRVDLFDKSKRPADEAG